MPKNIMTDAEVKLAGYLSGKKYPEPFRLVRYYDEEDGREFTFLTNVKQLSALDVANLYKKRWLIELFFKWLKQHLKYRNSGVQRRMPFAYKSVSLLSHTVLWLLSNMI